MATLNISGNTCTSVIGTYNEYNISGSDTDSLLRQIADLEARLPDGELKPAVEELDSAVKSGEKSKIVETVKKYAAEFSTQTFSNLAGAGLFALIKSILKI